MVVLLHGIPDWIAPAGTCPGRGATPAATEFPDLRLQYPACLQPLELWSLPCFVKFFAGAEGDISLKHV
jgi:hypothetical protein